MKPHDHSAGLVWAGRFYSRTLKKSVWIALSYPFSSTTEKEYHETMRVLKLKCRSGVKGKIWPRPFTSPDGRAYFVGSAAG